MIEKWRDIPGYKGYYEVSDLGRVRSLDRRILNNYGSYIKQGKLKKPFLSRNGYPLVQLHKNNKQQNRSVHRLVAEAFIPNPDNLPEVNHKNEVKSNNKATNLEWCTSQQNIEYSQAKYYSFIDPDGIKVEVFNLRRFCRDNKLDPSHMGKVASEKSLQHKGWTKV